MYLELLIFYSLFCFSLTFGFIESPSVLAKLARRIVKFVFFGSDKIIKCYHCAGFWISLIFSPVFVKLSFMDIHDINLIYYVIILFMVGIYGAGTSYLLHLIDRRLENDEMGNV